jgi:hypothetical protein
MVSVLYAKLLSSCFSKAEAVADIHLSIILWGFLGRMQGKESGDIQKYLNESYLKIPHILK